MAISDIKDTDIKSKLADPGRTVLLGTTDIVMSYESYTKSIR